MHLPSFCGDNIYTDDNNCFGSIGISRRRLHYSTRDRTGSTLLVYMLKDDYSWLLRHTILIADLLAKPSSYFFAGLKRIVNRYRKEAWFDFYDFHPNCDNLYLITPHGILFYRPNEKLLVLYHFQPGEREIVLCQNYSFPYSHCPRYCGVASKRTSWANF
ncbi:hypothetical protein OROMI_013839 [Orobanche minor]